MICLSSLLSVCSFMKSMDFLGMTMSKDGVLMDPAKVTAIQDYQVPCNVKGVRWLLGLANFYQWFIPNFASIVKLLMELTKKDYKFCWGTVEQGAFDTLKQTFISRPVLVYPDPHCLLHMETDASAFA